MLKLNQNYIKKIVRLALDEDLKPFGDITSKLIKNKKNKAKIIAKQNGIIAGLSFCKSAFSLTGKETIFSSKIKDGMKVRKGSVIAKIYANNKPYDLPVFGCCSSNCYCH
mgnify:CR=1 FL=1